MKRYWTTAIVLFSLFIALPNSFAQSDRLEAARRHMVRGGAAVEMAIANKSPGDLQDAAREFRKATELAPEMAQAWYNLGSVESKLGHHAEAIAAYQRYLQVNPKAEDAQKVQDDIIKLQYQQERHEESVKPGWTLIGVESQNGINLNYFIDRSKIKKTIEGISVTALFDYQKDVRWGPSILASYYVEWVFDCGGNRSKFMGAIYYSGHMGNGAVINEVSPAKSHPESGIGKIWTQVKGGVNDESLRQIFEAACRYQ